LAAPFSFIFYVLSCIVFWVTACIQFLVLMNCTSNGKKEGKCFIKPKDFVVVTATGLY